MPDPTPNTEYVKFLERGYDAWADHKAKLERYREALERIAEDDGVGDRTEWMKAKARQALEEQSGE